jgi:predicted cupin superfamily sugar epimerase
LTKAFTLPLSGKGDFSFRSADAAEIGGRQIMKEKNLYPEQIIRELKLEAHPEGGWYRQTYVSPGRVPPSAMPDGRGERPWSTSILFLLTGRSFSALHRIRSDELWYHHSGDAVYIEIIHPGGRHERKIIGRAEEGCEPQASVPAGCWFGSHTAVETGWALTGCSVAPGFDFQDFELADRLALCGEFPAHRELIVSLTR